MKFIESTSMKVVISKEQERQLSSKERMKRAFLDSSVLAFDVYEKENLIGFIMVKNFDVESYFLWNYAIDYSFQNKGYGTKTLNEFIEYMKDKYNNSSSLEYFERTYDKYDMHPETCELLRSWLSLVSEKGENEAIKIIKKVKDY